MDEINTNNIVEKMIYSINDFKDEMVKSMNYIRQDVRDLKEDVRDVREDIKGVKEEISDLRTELRDYKEENNKLWDENRENWSQYKANREKDRSDILDILTNYDISISQQLGDPNAEKMRKIV